ncbi:MAG: CPBP family intramembrane glutamic endopeptidase [Chitinophagaceae bacterium]
MSIFLSYFRDFLKSIHVGLLLFCSGYAALLIFLNYYFGIEPKILLGMSNRFIRFAGFYLVYFSAFFVPYLAWLLLKGRRLTELKPLMFLVLIAPAIFALKVSFGGLTDLIINNTGETWGKYYGIISNLPSRLVLVLLSLLLVWWIGQCEKPFFGVTLKNFNWRPYLLMLLIMIPLISWASTQNDFLHTYPKMKQVAFVGANTRYPRLFHLLFELSYGIDFITIELFFRGFLVLAFVRYAGQEAILPMAVFYCSIHFGKPLAECISSFFGGMILGIVVYRTRTIIGGLIVHLGIAWMMEVGGYVGNVVK